MSNNKKKNVALFIAAAMLLLALFNGWQYGFFTLLRFVIFATTGYVAWMAYEEHKEKWVWLYGFVAVLFNPFFPIYFERGTWIVIDLLTAIFLLLTIFLVRFQGNKVNSFSNKNGV